MYDMESRAVGSREKIAVLSSKMLLPANALTSAREVPNRCDLGTNFYRESSARDNCFDAVRVQDLADLAFYENVMKAVPNDLWCGQGGNVSDGVSSSSSSLLHPKSVHGEDESSSKAWYPVTASHARDPSVIDSSEHSRVSSSSVSNVPMKRIRPTSLNGTPVCQVNDCNMDLTSSKSYNKRHKVCELHSKIEKVTVNGVEQRFCQQCSRFHLLSEFDESKRSCRKRLSGHNERRRKPQPSFDYRKIDGVQVPKQYAMPEVTQWRPSKLI